MNWGALGAIGELAGGVAVVITLVYLAMQLKQVIALPFGRPRGSNPVVDIT